MKLAPQTLELLARFRRALDGKMSPNTARAYSGDVRTFAVFLLEARGKALLDSREDDVGAYLSRTSAAVQSATLKRHRAGLAAFFEWASQAGLTSPMPVVALAAKPDSDPTTCVRAFRSALQRYGTLRDRAICALVFDAAIPVTSVGTLRRVDLDASGERWSVHLTNRRFLRQVSLQEPVRRCLADYLASLGEETSEFLFPTRQAESMSFTTIPVIVHHYCRLAGLDRDLRSLRKAFALERHRTPRSRRRAR